MNFPVIVVNFKTYAQATGALGVALAKQIEEAVKEKDGKVILAVQAADIRLIAQSVSLPVFAQHIDEVQPGSHTGWTLAEAVKEAGAVGTLISHSEHRLATNAIELRLERAMEAGLETIVCARTAQKAKKVASLDFKPTAIAVEPPELIGRGISVSKARPELITDAVKQVHKISKIPVLCGAGIKSGKDVEKALKLGAVGVLLASGVAKAQNPKAAMLEIIGGTK